MPNWCTNRLRITKPCPELKQWLEKENFSFEKMNPPKYPEGEDDAKDGGWKVIDAQRDAWGTKWDLDEQDQKRVAHELLRTKTSIFDTAWTPPELAIEKLSAMFPEARFLLEYYELGCFFAGHTIFHNGKKSVWVADSEEAIKEFARDKFGESFEEDWEDEESEQDTGETHCDESPYQDAYDAADQAGLDSKRFKTEATRELDFLEEVLALFKGANQKGDEPNDSKIE